MKARFLLFCATLVLGACAKKEKPSTPEPEPETAKKGSLEVRVLSYDSLGTLNNEHGGIKVVLTGGSTLTTGPNGIVTFNDLAYGHQAPMLFRNGFEGAPQSMLLNSGHQSITIPMAQRSGFYIPSLNGNAESAGKITLNIGLNKPLPAGKSCRLAILADTVAGLNVNRYKSLDTITITNQFVNDLNVALLPGLTVLLEPFKKNKLFYIMAVPASYGIYDSNLEGKIVLGENLQPSDDLQLVKNW